MSSKRDEEESDRDSTKEKSKRHKNSRSQEYRTATLLSLGAVILSVLALASAFVSPGIMTPRSVMARHSNGGYAAIGATCTHYPGAEVSISVPGAGTVIVSATVGVGVNHTFGISDTAVIVVGSSTSECTVNNYTAFVSVPYSLPTDPYHFITVPLLRSFSVDASSTMTFYVNGLMSLGASSGDRFDSASLVAVFYPR